MTAIHKILETDPSGKALKPVCWFHWFPWGCPDDNDLGKLGMRIVAEPEDYVHAATEWIINAEKYRNELVDRRIASYMGETMY